MSLFSSFRRIGSARPNKQYAAAESTAAGIDPDEERPAKENVNATTVEVDQKGEVMVHCDPVQRLGHMDIIGHSTMHRTSARNTFTKGSAMSMCNTIPAGAAGPDLSKSTLTCTGNMADSQASFSPLQGTARIQTMGMRQTCRLPTIPTQVGSKTSMFGAGEAGSALGAMGMSMKQTQGTKQLGSELGNLSMDLHGQWLDAFSACPIPGVVLSMTTDEPQALLVNSACVTALGRDSHTLTSKGLADLIGSKNSSCCNEAAEAGFEFAAPNCSVQVGSTMQCSSLFIPISDVCSPGKPPCYMMLLLDTFAQALCSDKLKRVPSYQVKEGTPAPNTDRRRGLYTVGDQEPEDSNYNPAVAILRGYAEAAQRRMNGVSLGVSMPAQFDATAWIEMFEKMLTVDPVK